jgi:hypothetical protein
VVAIQAAILAVMSNRVSGRRFDRRFDHDLKHRSQFPHLIAVGVFCIVIADASRARAGALN